MSEIIIYGCTFNLNYIHIDEEVKERKDEEKLQWISIRVHVVPSKAIYTLVVPSHQD